MQLAPSLQVLLLCFADSVFASTWAAAFNDSFWITGRIPSLLLRHMYILTHYFPSTWPFFDGPIIHQFQFFGSVVFAFDFLYSRKEQNSRDRSEQQQRKRAERKISNRNRQMNRNSIWGIRDHTGGCNKSSKNNNIKYHTSIQYENEDGKQKKTIHVRQMKTKQKRKGRKHHVKN